MAETKKFTVSGNQVVEKIKQLIHEGNIRNELHAIDSVLPTMAAREWSLVESPGPSLHFVCCDHPLSLVGLKGCPPGPLGYGLRRTEVSVPLTKEMALVGRFEEDLGDASEHGEELIRRINHRTERSARRQIYSSRPEFATLRPAPRP